ncbi:MAG: hypothetical protein KIS92_24835 [Planctomycetota bacterium]|nr:hypothetical protein [Planctomycetota bacterium]
MKNPIDWAWLPRLLPAFPRKWMLLRDSIHEPDPVLPALFPNADLLALDLRALLTPRGNLTVPAADGSRDTALAQYPLAELPDAAARLRLFAELKRTLKPGGAFVLIEHLRGAWNRFAFGLNVARLRSREECLAFGEETGFHALAECEVAHATRAFVWTA